MIKLTKDAADNIFRLQAEYNAVGWGLRFGLSGGGCSGYKYIIEFEEIPGDNDVVYTLHEIKIFIDRKTLQEVLK